MTSAIKPSACRSAFRLPADETGAKAGVQPVQPVQPCIETFQNAPYAPLYPLFIKNNLYREYRLDRLDIPVVQSGLMPLIGWTRLDAGWTLLRIMILAMSLGRRPICEYLGPFF